MGQSLRPGANDGIGGTGTDPGVRTMNAMTVGREWRDVVERVCHGDHRVIVERSGIPVAANVYVADLDRLQEIAAHLAPPSRSGHTTNLA